MGGKGLGHHGKVATMARSGRDDDVARTDLAGGGQITVVDQATVEHAGQQLFGKHLRAVIAGDHGEPGTGEHGRQGAADVAAAEDIGEALRAERLEVDGSSVRIGHAGGDARLDIDHGERRRAHDGRSGLRAMGRSVRGTGRRERREIDLKRSIATFYQHFFKLLKKLQLIAIKMEIAQVDHAAAHHAGIAYAATHGIAHRARGAGGEQLHGLAYGDVLHGAASHGARDRTGGIHGHPGAGGARGRPARTRDHRQLDRTPLLERSDQRACNLKLLHRICSFHHARTAREQRGGATSAPEGAGRDRRLRAHRRHPLLHHKAGPYPPRSHSE